MSNGISLSPVHIVFDIDGVLAAPGILDSHQGDFFHKKGFVLTAIKTHYIFPGVIELLRLLLQTENLHVSFFSSGGKERNVIFVQEILQQAIGIEEYKKIKGSVQILSREDLSASMSAIGREREELANIKNTEQRKTYGMGLGNMAKDLTKIQKDLENVVLVEDDSSYVAYGQARNLLYVPETDQYSYERLNPRWGYAPDGYRPMQCRFDDPDSSDYYDDEDIQVIRDGDQFQVKYLDFESNQHKQIPIKDEKLRQALNELASKVWIEEPSITRELYALVEAQKGRIKRLCRKVNRIYYVAGLLFTALEKAKQEKTSITEQLFRLQFIPTSQTTFKPIFKSLTKRDYFYEIGLKILKQVNKNLEFTTPQNYKNILNQKKEIEEESKV